MDIAKPLSRAALLIDAENISGTRADEILLKASRVGALQVRRIYGDFSTGLLRDWVEPINRYAITPRQIFRQASGKNSADIALIIDAMDLLHAQKLDALLVASSDSDFSHLARRAREDGIVVYGFGAAPIQSPFRQACTNYFEIGQAAMATPASVPVATRLPTPTVVFTPPKPAPVSPAPPKVVTVGPPTPAPKAPAKPDFVPMVRQVLNAMEKADGWVALNLLGTKIRQAHVNFDPKKFGSASLSKLLASSTEFQVDTKTAPGGRVRLAAEAQRRSKAS